jgi:methionyl-tRNA formyltransferase
MWNTKDAIYIQLHDGVLEVVEWQMEGKKRMSTHDWLVGNKISDWKIG